MAVVEGVMPAGVALDFVTTRVKRQAFAALPSPTLQEHEMQQV